MPEQPLPPAVPAAQQGADPRQSQMAIRYNSNDFERQFNAERQESGWGHVRPFSVYVAAMGNHWAPGSWAAMLDAVQFANENGMYCQLDEIQDRCTRPYDALGTMRNEAIMRAMYGGYEYLLYVDNDVLPPQDTIYRMVRYMYEEQRTIMVPHVSEPGTGRPLHGPVRQKYSGVQPIRWAVLSFLMFKTTVFNAFPGGTFWSDAIGADEGFHYQKLYSVGHMPIITTEIVVPVAQAPTYPLTIQKQDNAEEEWAAKTEQFKAIPDRRPRDPNDPRVSPEGVYMPFLPVLCRNCNQPRPGDFWRGGPNAVCGPCAQAIGEQKAQAQVAPPQVAPVADNVESTPEPPRRPQEGEVPPQPKKGEPGYYQRCSALSASGDRCNNKTPNPTGFCHVHADRQ